MKTWNRPCKNQARESAVQMDEVADVALFMPSHEQLCLKAALEAGSIDKNTYIVAVEKDPEIAADIQKFLDKNFKYALVFEGKLEDLNLSEDEYIAENGVDLAYIDFCGNFTNKVAKWVMKNSPLFNEGAHISYTFCPNVRQNLLLGEMETFWVSEDVTNQEQSAKNRLNEKIKIKLMMPCAGFDGDSPMSMSEQCTIQGIYGAMVANLRVELVEGLHYKDSRLPMLYLKFQIIENKEREVVLNRHNCPNATKMLARAYQRTTGQSIFTEPKRKAVKVKRIELNARQRRIKQRLTRTYGCHKGGAKWAWHKDNPNGCRN